MYQVGNAGTLPTLATAAAAPITVLPGFPTAIAKTAGATNDYPFGIWFANATTLYVADEGDGVVADAGSSTLPACRNGACRRNVEDGLRTAKRPESGQALLDRELPHINPATDGLRNITGM